MFWRKFLVSLLSKETVLPLEILSSMMMRVMKMEVRTEVTIPMMRVVAKPFTGPDPKRKSTRPVRAVVT